MKKLNRIKQTINALVSFERANLENEEFKNGMEDYCIATKNGYFWGFRRKFQDDFTKSEVETI